MSSREVHVKIKIDLTRFQAAIGRLSVQSAAMRRRRELRSRDLRLDQLLIDTWENEGGTTL